jgi:hypothetical protein
MDDQDRLEAIRMVQDFKAGRSSPSIAESIQKILLPQKSIHEVKAQQWTAEKSSQGLYRVIFQYAKNNVPQDLVFGADLRKGEVQALNHEALEIALP